MSNHQTRRGFTLIELLLVIAIIALLVGILLPGLSGARNEARAIKCAASARSVGQLMLAYSNDYRVYPPSYVYPSDSDGFNWRMDEQQGSDSSNGYLHWSYLITGRGETAQDAFQCPALWKGGAPAANWGTNDEDAEGWMINENPSVIDRQVKRVAYAPNDMIIPRNKFATTGNVQKPYRLVKQADVDSTAQGSSKTIVLAEWLNVDSYKSLSSTSQEGRIKSHRPITPVNNQGSSPFEPEKITARGSRIIPFFYPNVDASSGNSDLRTTDALGAGMIEDAQTVLNAIGRHHPPKGGAFGGTTNFTFLDGHVERLTIAETVQKRLWGDKFFSMTGDNRITPPNPATP